MLSNKRGKKSVIVSEGNLLGAFIDLSNRLFPGSDRWPKPDDNACESAFSELKVKLRGGENPFPDQAGAAKERFAVAVAIRNTLSSIANAEKEERAVVPIEIDASGIALDCVLIHPAYPPRTPGLIGGKDAEQRRSYEIEIIRPTWAGEAYRRFLDALKGVEATRIRECPICKRIYWARRRHMQVCSAGCRVQKWREENPLEWADIQDRFERKRTKSGISETKSRALERPIIGKRARSKPKKGGSL